MKSLPSALVFAGTLLLCAFFVFSATTLGEETFWGNYNGWQLVIGWLWEKAVFLAQWLLWGLAVVGLGDLVGWKMMCHWGKLAGVGLRLAIGYAVIAGTNFLLGTLGGMTQITLLIIPAIGFGWTLWRLFRWWLDKNKPTEAKLNSKPLSFSLWEILLLVGISVVLLWDVLYSFLPETSWDSLVYHLYLPKLWLGKGFLYAPPWNDYARMPLLMSLVYTSGLAMPLAEAGARGAALWATLGGALLAGSLARRELPRSAAWLAMLFILVEPVVGGQASVTGSDSPTILFLFAAWVLLFPPEGKKPYPLVAGIMAGCLIGIKLVAIYGVVALGLLLIYLWIKKEPKALKNIAFYILGVLAAYLPWMIRAYWLTGNPVYPFAANIFGRGDMPPDVARQLNDWLWGMGMGRELVDYLLLPVRIFFSARAGYEHFDGMANPAYLLLIPFAIFFLPKQRQIRFLLFAAIVVFILWAMGPQQMRFLAPMLVLMAVAWGKLVESLKGITRWMARTIAYLGLVACMYCTASSICTFEIPMTFGCMDIFNYRVSKISIIPACNWIDKNLPPDAKLVMVYYNRAFACPRPVLAESYFEATRMGYQARELGARGLANWFITSGYNYILMSKSPRYQGMVLNFMEVDEKVEFLKFLSNDISPLYEDEETLVGRIIAR